MQSAVQDGLWVARIWKGIAESCKGQATGHQDIERYYSDVYVIDLIMVRQEVILTR